METRALIIETAFLAFIEQGYDRVSLNQIVKTTGLTKGAFYHHFSSKAELIQEVLNTYFFSHIQKTMDIVDIEGQSFRERMNVVFENVMKVDIRLVGQPERVIDRNDFMKLFWESMNLNEEMRRKSYEYQQNIVLVMKRAIEAGIVQNEIRDDVNAAEVAQLMNATVRGTILTTNLLSNEESEAMLRQNIGVIMKLITK